MQVHRSNCTSLGAPANTGSRRDSDCAGDGGPEGSRFRGRAARRAAGGVTIPLPLDPAEAWGQRDRYHVTGTIEGLGFRPTLVHQSTWQIVLGPAARGRDSFSTESFRLAAPLVTSALKAPHDVGANASEANHSKLHRAAPADWL